MKAILRTACSIFLFFISLQTTAQCTQAQLNWDNLDYYYSSAGNKPYGSFISIAQAQSQKFAIGTTYATIATPASASFIMGEDSLHTGDVTVSGISYTGADAHFSPFSGETITITFGAEVQDVRFTMYDIDAAAQYYISATDALGFPKVLNATFQSPTILNTDYLLLPTNNTTQLFLTAANTTLAASSNEGTATVTIPGGVKQITIGLNAMGTEPQIWLSDITACVSGSFPNAYYAHPNTRPYTGQPAYFASTPDNAYAYMVGLNPDVNPATTTQNYVATRLFFDSTRFINSLAYDPQNRIMYYVLDATVSGTTNANNKQLKKYDFNTETSSMVIADLNWLGIPTFEQGVESAGASFYNGALYLGIEGGRHNDGTPASPVYSTTRETIIYKIEFDASGNPINAYQVWAKQAYNNNGNVAAHDWGDFLIMDGVLYDFNTSQTTANAAVHIFNLFSGNMTTLANPTPTQPYVGQAALDWYGTMYSVRTSVQTISPTLGILGSQKTISATSGSISFPMGSGGAGDATEPFRPKVDMGDAPSTYDPDPLAPALHDFSENRVRIGAIVDREWDKSASTQADADGVDEDGISRPFVLNNGTNYTVTVSVFNNPTTNIAATNTATLAAWLDFNLNGVFDPSEGLVRSVPKSSSVQNITLTWPTASFPLPPYTYTYLRFRIASDKADNAFELTVNKPTGYMSNGEVEDYFVLVNNWPLNLNDIDFTAQKQGADVQLKWHYEGDDKISKYIVTRSSDGQHFEPISEVKSNQGKNYTVYDRSPMQGKSFYRLQVIDLEGKTGTGAMKSIEFESVARLNIYPNPSIASAHMELTTTTETRGTITFYNATGLPVYTQAASFRKGRNVVYVNTQLLPPDVYLVEVKTGAFTERTKLVVRK